MHLTLETTPVFSQNYHSDKFITVNRGGTRSSKSRSLCQIALMWLITGNYSSKRPDVSKGTFSIVRRFSATIDATIMVDLEEEIEKQGVWGLIEKNIQKKTYKHGLRTIQFIGADDQQKLRGRKQDILYCNEANELGFKDEFFQLLMRTSEKIFIDFNPDDADVWINTEIEQKRATEKRDVDVIVSNYTHNTFLSKRQINEIEYLKDTDPEFWKVYGLGEYGRKVGLIYTHWKLCESIPDGEVFYGLDFGYNNPTALVRVVKHDNVHYVKQLLYERGLTNSDLIVKMQGMDLGRWPIYCDTAEPNRIEELTRAGFNAKPSDKGKDSVRKGVDTVKAHGLMMDSGSPDLLKEIRKYSWQTGKDGKPDPENPIKFDDHLMDAMRMSIFTHSKPSGWYGLG